MQHKNNIGKYSLPWIFFGNKFLKTETNIYTRTILSIQSKETRENTQFYPYGRLKYTFKIKEFILFYKFFNRVKMQLH